MADIDVTDILLDPNIAGQTFSVIRRQEVVSAAGISTVVAQTVPGVIGSVQPGGDNGLIREADYDAQAKTLKVVTAFRLRGPSVNQMGQNFKPDIVVWNEDNYEVRTLTDYTDFGAGMVEAECVAIDYVDQAPAPPENVYP